MTDYRSLEHIIRDIGLSGTDSRRKVMTVGRPEPNATDGTKTRRKVELVGRPTSMTPLARQMAIQHNIIDETERPDDDVQIAISKFKGNRGNKVDVHPLTDDRNNDNQRQDNDSKKARRLSNVMIGQPGSKGMTEEFIRETKASDESAKTPLQKAYQKLNGKTVGQSSGLTKMTQKITEEELADEVAEEFITEFFLSEDTTQAFARSVDSEGKRTRNALNKKLGKKIYGKKRMKTKPKQGSRGDPALERHKRTAKRAGVEWIKAGGDPKHAPGVVKHAFQQLRQGGMVPRAQRLAADYGDKLHQNNKEQKAEATKKQDALKAAGAAAARAKAKEAANG